MKSVFNLATASSVPHSTYEDSISDLYAVCAAYCDANDELPWLDAMNNNGMLNHATELLPVVIGTHTIACGDYGMVKTKENIS